MGERGEEKGTITKKGKKERGWDVKGNEWGRGRKEGGRERDRERE